MINKKSIFIGLCKISANIRDLRMATSSIRNLKIKGRRFFRVGGLTKDKVGSIPSSVAKKTWQPQAGSIERLGFVPTHIPKNMSSAIITGKGGAYKGFEKSPIVGRPPKGRSQKEAINRITSLHEAQEVKKSLSGDVKILSHNSLGVIMDESNLIKSLPGRYNPTKRFFSNIRNEERTSGLIRKYYPGFEYGKTKLSPAAKRHVLKRLKAEA